MYSVQPGYLEDAIRDADDAVRALEIALDKLEAAQARAAGPPEFCNGDDWLYEAMRAVVGVLENTHCDKCEHILRQLYQHFVAEAGR